MEKLELAKLLVGHGMGELRDLSHIQSGVLPDKSCVFHDGFGDAEYLYGPINRRNVGLLDVHSDWEVRRYSEVSRFN